MGNLWSKVWTAGPKATGGNDSEPRPSKRNNSVASEARPEIQRSGSGAQRKGNEVKIHPSSQPKIYKSTLQAEIKPAPVRQEKHKPEELQSPARTPSDRRDPGYGLQQDSRARTSPSPTKGSGITPPSYLTKDSQNVDISLDTEAQERAVSKYLELVNSTNEVYQSTLKELELAKQVTKDDDHNFEMVQEVTIDDEDLGFSKVDEEEAAVKIQAAFRGYKTRKDVGLMVKLDEKGTTAADQRGAAMSAKSAQEVRESGKAPIASPETSPDIEVIPAAPGFRTPSVAPNVAKFSTPPPQSPVRISIIRPSVDQGKENVEEAAVKIQAAYRGYKVRKDISRESSPVQQSISEVDTVEDEQSVTASPTASRTEPSAPWQPEMLKEKVTTQTSPPSTPSTDDVIQTSLKKLPFDLPSETSVKVEKQRDKVFEFASSLLGDDESPTGKLILDLNVANLSVSQPTEGTEARSVKDDNSSDATSEVEGGMGQRRQSVKELVAMFDQPPIQEQVPRSRRSVDLGPESVKTTSNGLKSASEQQPAVDATKKELATAVGEAKDQLANLAAGLAEISGPVLELVKAEEPAIQPNVTTSVVTETSAATAIACDVVQSGNEMASSPTSATNAGLAETTKTSVKSPELEGFSDVLSTAAEAVSTVVENAKHAVQEQLTTIANANEVGQKCHEDTTVESVRKDVENDSWLLVEPAGEVKQPPTGTQTIAPEKQTKSIEESLVDLGTSEEIASTSAIEIETGSKPLVDATGQEVLKVDATSSASVAAEPSALAPCATKETDFRGATASVVAEPSVLTFRAVDGTKPLGDGIKDDVLQVEETASASAAAEPSVLAFRATTKTDFSGATLVKSSEQISTSVDDKCQVDEPCPVQEPDEIPEATLPAMSFGNEPNSKHVKLDEHVEVASKIAANSSGTSVLNQVLSEVEKLPATVVHKVQSTVNEQTTVESCGPSDQSNASVTSQIDNEQHKSVVEAKQELLESGDLQKFDDNHNQASISQSDALQQQQQQQQQQQPQLKNFQLQQSKQAKESENVQNHLPQEERQISLLAVENEPEGLMVTKTQQEIEQPGQVDQVKPEMVNTNEKHEVTKMVHEEFSSKSQVSDESTPLPSKTDSRDTDSTSKDLKYTSEQQSVVDATKQGLATAVGEAKHQLANLAAGLAEISSPVLELVKAEKPADTHIQPIVCTSVAPEVSATTAVASDVVQPGSKVVSSEQSATDSGPKETSKTSVKSPELASFSDYLSTATEAVSTIVDNAKHTMQEQLDTIVNTNEIGQKCSEDKTITVDSLPKDTKSDQHANLAAEVLDPVLELVKAEKQFDTHMPPIASTSVLTEISAATATVPERTSATRELPSNEAKVSATSPDFTPIPIVHDTFEISDSNESQHVTCAEAVKQAVQDIDSLANPIGVVCEKLEPVVSPKTEGAEAKKLVKKESEESGISDTGDTSPDAGSPKLVTPFDTKGRLEPSKEPSNIKETQEKKEEKPTIKTESIQDVNTTKVELQHEEVKQDSGQKVETADSVESGNEEGAPSEPPSRKGARKSSPEPAASGLTVPQRQQRSASPNPFGRRRKRGKKGKQSHN